MMGLQRHELRALKGDFAFQFDAPSVEGYVIGRMDEMSALIPDIDLTKAGGRARGISRRHAALVRYHGATHLIDLHSVNGTYLNGKRLQPDVPHPLNSGDELRFGTLDLRFIQIG
jgi:pSer/pThr/pTyr-binding forkhead associated (FHA) protein